MAGAQVPLEGAVDANGLALGGKDKIAMAEAVDLICENLSKDWEQFTTQLQQMADLLGQELSVDSIEKALIVEEAKRKIKNPESGKKGEEKALVSHEKKGLNGKSCKFEGKCHYCKKEGHKENDCWVKDPSKRPSRLGGRRPRQNNDKNDNSGGQAMGLIAQEDHKRQHETVLIYEGSGNMGG